MKSGKTANALVCLKALSPNCTGSCIHHHKFTVFLKKSVSPKKVLDEEVKIINFINSRLLSIHLFNILSDKVRITHNALLLHTEEKKCNSYLQEKYLHD